MFECKISISMYFAFATKKSRKKALKNQNKRLSKMTRKNFYLQVLILAVPIALQNLLTALLNIFDQMMVGWLPGGIADSGLSAVLLANR